MILSCILFLIMSGRKADSCGKLDISGGALCLVVSCDEYRGIHEGEVVADSC